MENKKEFILHWITFSSAYNHEQEQEVLNCTLPEPDEEILVTDGKNVWIDTFCFDSEEYYLENSNKMLVDEVTHWMPLPKPI